MNIFKKPYYYLEWNHNNWGDRLEGDWDGDKVRFSGHLWRRPNKGDRVIFKMKSGKLGEVKITNVEYCQDPKDMFFADGKAIGYIDQSKLDKILEKQGKDDAPFRFV